MERKVSRASIIASIVRKDLVEFSRDTLYIFLSVVGLVMFIGVFWISPSTVDETITLGVHQTGLDQLISEFEEGAEESEGLALVEFDTEQELRDVVAGDVEAWRSDTGELVLRDRREDDPQPEDAERVDVMIGIGFPDGFLEDTATGERTTVRVFADAAAPTEIKSAMASFVREIAYNISGNELPVSEPDEENIILGTDRAGEQVSLRERMRPLLAMFVLMLEVFALSSLIASEVLNRTITAVLVTPAKIGDFLAAKTIYGMMLASAQGLIVLLGIGAFTAENWLLLLVTMVVGSLMFTGIAMVVGSGGRDFIGTLFGGMTLTVPLMIPAFSTLFPGTASQWVQLLPSYGLIQVLVGATSYGQGWSELAPYLAMTVAWVLAIYLIGLFVLKRKVETL